MIRLHLFMVPIHSSRPLATAAENDLRSPAAPLFHLDAAIERAGTSAERARALCEKATFLQLLSGQSAQVASHAEEALALMDGQPESLRNLETIAYSAGLLVHILKDSDRLRAQRLALRAMSAIRHAIEDPQSSADAVYHLCQLASYVHADLEQWTESNAWRSRALGVPVGTPFEGIGSVSEDAFRSSLQMLLGSL